MGLIWLVRYQVRQINKKLKLENRKMCYDCLKVYDLTTNHFRYEVNHGSQRWSSYCISCCRLRDNQRYEKDKQIILERNKRWAVSHHESRRRSNRLSYHKRKFEKR